MSKESRFVRTTITNANGTISRARVNLNTGEVTKFNGKQRNTQSRATPKAGVGESIPFWEVMMNQENTEEPRRTINSSKSVDNPYFGMLNDFDIYETKGDSQLVCAEDELDEDGMDTQIAALRDNRPFMDNYFTCVSHLGPSNPLSKNVLFSLLKRLPEISSDTIHQSTSYSVGYCQRLATALRVFIKLTT